MLSPTDDADDLLQEVFIVAGRKLSALTYGAPRPWLSLSDGYTAAITEAQRAAFVAAAEALLAASKGTAFHVSYVLGYVAKITIGLVMLRSTDFGRAAGILGILAGVTGLGFYVPTVGMLLSILSVLLIAVWHVLVGRSPAARAKGVQPGV